MNLHVSSFFSYFHRSQKMNIDTETALKMLQKKDHVVDSPNVRRLLQETLSTRRSWIEKKVKEANVTAKFPQLAIYDLV